MTDGAGRFRGPFPPVLTGLMRLRPAAAMLSVAGAVQVLLTALGLPCWPCLWRAATGVDCPACGLSRGVAALARGHWDQALTHHALSPLFAAALALLAAAAVLPGRWRDRLIDNVRSAEAWTGIVWIAAGLMVVRWAVVL